MRTKPLIHVLILIALLLGVAACNLPMGPTQTGSLPTPDTTITALFEFITTAQAAQTVVALPATLPPTATEAAEAPAEEATTAPTTAPTTQPVAAATSTPVPPTETAEPTEAEAPAEDSSGDLSGSAERSGASVLAYYLQDEPTIDGVFDEWDQTRYAVDRVVYGGNRWDGDDDLSGTFMIAWDDYFLYIAARVIDDTYAQEATGKNLFKGDSIEMLLDINVPRDFNDRRLSLDDFQIGISPGQSEPSSDIETYLWYPRSRAGVYKTIKAAALPTDDGYRIEAKIPWDIFDITPDIGKHYGFAFSISDNDNEDDNVQQSMVSNTPNRHLTDPTTWGDLTLRGRP